MVSLIMYFFIFSLQVTKFPGKELPVLPVFWHLYTRPNCWKWQSFQKHSKLIGSNNTVCIFDDYIYHRLIWICTNNKRLLYIVPCLHKLISVRFCKDFCALELILVPQSNEKELTVQIFKVCFCEVDLLPDTEKTWKIYKHVGVASKSALVS